MGNNTSLGIDIPITITGADKLKSTETGLAGVEAAGERAKTVLAALGRDGSPALEKIRQSTQAATTPFDGLVAALKREQETLDKIQKPLRELAEGHETLDALMRKGMITAEQYTEKLEKLEQAAGKTPKEGPTGGLESGVGVAGAVIGGGVGAEIVEMGKKFGEIIEAGNRVRDMYIGMQNASIRFTDSARTTDTVIDEQSKLAEELHSTFGPTVELYGRVKEGSDGLNLSHKEQIELTKALGEEVQLAGRPLGDAAGLMSRFSFSMQTGHIETRQLTQIMREVPGLVDVWEKAFHKSISAILADVKAGKTGPEELVQAIARSGEGIEKQYAQHKVTNEILKDQFLEEQLINDQRLKGMSFSERLNKSNAEAAGWTHTIADGMAQVYDAVDDTQKKIAGDATEGLRNLGTITEELEKQWAVIAHDAENFLGHLQNALGFEDALFSMQTAAGRAFKLANDEARKIGEAKLHLQALNDVAAAGGKIVDIDEKRKALLEQIGGEEQKYFDSIKAPMLDAIKHREMLNDYIKQGLVTDREALEASLKLEASIGRRAEINTSDGFIGGVRGQRAQRFGLGGADTNALDVGAVHFSSTRLRDQLEFQGAEGSTAAPEKDAALTRIMELYDSTRTAAEKYADEVAEVNRLSIQAGITDDARAKILKNLQVEYNKSLAEQAHKQDEEVANSLKKHEEDVKKMAESIDKVLEPVGKTFIDGVKQGKLSLEDMARSGVDALEQILAKAIETKAALALAGLLTPAASGPGTSGNEVNALGLMIPGMADGGYLQIPHAADGLKGLVPMRSGRDTHLLRMFVREGEDVTVRTPEQRAAAQSDSGGSAPPVIQNHVHVHDDPRALGDYLGSTEGKRHVVNIMRQHSHLL
jgi:hypothetical protein